jgi:hypothetical protein
LALNPFVTLAGPAAPEEAGGVALHLLHRYAAVLAALLFAIVALRLRKDQMNEAEYQQQLEKLLTDLALKDRAIRELEAKK